MFQKAKQIMLSLGIVGIMTACADLPGMHKIDIIQGNYIEENRLNNIEKGMSQHEVKLILGTPLVSDEYNDGVWYYVFVHHKSNGEKLEHRQVKIYFDAQDRVERIDREGVFTNDYETVNDDQ